MADQHIVPTSEWFDNLKLVMLGLPLTTIVVRWIAKYLKDARITEHKEWLKSEDGQMHMQKEHQEWLRSDEGKMYLYSVIRELLLEKTKKD